MRSWARGRARRGAAMAASDKAGYGLDNAWRDARARLTALENRLDPGTTRHLRARGVGAGWRCLEVGVGGSIVLPAASFDLVHCP